MSYAHFHITYRDRSGAIQTGRIAVTDNVAGAPNHLRNKAMREARFKYADAARVVSAVRVYPREA